MTDMTWALRELAVSRAKEDSTKKENRVEWAAAEKIEFLKFENEMLHERLRRTWLRDSENGPFPDSVFNDVVLNLETKHFHNKDDLVEIRQLNGKNKALHIIIREIRRKVDPHGVERVIARIVKNVQDVSNNEH